MLYAGGGISLSSLSFAYPHPHPPTYLPLPRLLRVLPSCLLRRWADESKGGGAYKVGGEGGGDGHPAIGDNHFDDASL